MQPAERYGICYVIPSHPIYKPVGHPCQGGTGHVLGGMHGSTRDAADTGLACPLERVDMCSHGSALLSVC